MRRLILSFLLLCIAGGIAFAWRPAIHPLDPGNQLAFEPELVRRGATLATMGNCATCHTRPGGKGLEGGLPIPTPFGSIYSTNITPDPETGIGRWPEAAFARALREGVDIDGRHLYPAFPYDHYTLLSDDDVHALYAYAMTRQPVNAASPANDLKFPFTFRPAIAAWKAVYFRDHRYQPDSKQTGIWNRGAYLSEGLAHCGACHTPRNILGAEEKSEAYNGAPVEGWYAYAINAASPAPLPWTEQALTFYLSHGWEEHHGIARGPMVPVATNLATAPRDDVQAMATYIATLAASPDQARKEKGQRALEAAGKISARKLGSADSLVYAKPDGSESNKEGALIFAAACASCHESGRPLPYGGLNLNLSTAVNGPTPSNIINVTLYGLPQQPGTAAPIMPGFRGSLTDEQITALLSYIRAKFSSNPPWPEIRKDVKAAREHMPRLWPTPGSRALIANSSQEVSPW
jgi:mono/diheme cytochrome c family protein